jgi:hypothetical protein
MLQSDLFGFARPLTRQACRHWLATRVSLYSKYFASSSISLTLEIFKVLLFETAILPGLLSIAAHKVGCPGSIQFAWAFLLPVLLEESFV